MKTPARLFFVLAATCLAFVGSASAQVVTNVDTRPSYFGSVFTFGGAGSQMGQTFTNVSAVTSMTYNFFTGSGGSATATDLTATFGQWDTGTNAFIGGTTVDFGPVSVPESGTAATPLNGWTSVLANNGGSYLNFSYTFDLTSLTGPQIHETYGYLTSPANTYALMLTNTGTATGLALGQTQTGGAFLYGTAWDGFDYVKDWTFAQISVYAGNQDLVPIPESSTVAALAGAVLVTGLVIVRTRQRRQVAVTPTSAA